MQAYTKTSESKSKTSDRPPKDFWQTYKPKEDSPDEPDEQLTAEQIASATDAINYVLVAWGFPEKRRAFIDAVIGASNGSMDWFEATDFEIGHRAREVSSQGRSRQSIEKWTQREREETVTWQTDYARTLLETMPGGQANNVNYKSQYRARNLFNLAIETDRQARQSRDWERNRKRALRRAAKTLFQAKRHEFMEPPKRQRFRKPRQDCALFMKLIDTYTDKLCGQALIEKRDLPELLEYIEVSVRRRRLKYTDFPQVENQSQPTDTVEDNPHGGVDTFVHSQNGGKTSFVHREECGQSSEIREENAAAAYPPCDSSLPSLDSEVSPETTHPGEESQGGMAAALETVAATIDQVIFKNDMTKEKDSAHSMTTEQFKAELPELIADAERGGVSLIARVRGPVLQIDDCDIEAVKLLEPYAFITIETSQDNFQVWFAFKDDDDKVVCRDRLFARLKEIAPGVNPGAGGALRWPGSINFKPGRNNWRVRIHSINQGRITTPAELDDAGLLADPERQAFDWDPNGPPGAWPDYQRCVEDKTVNGVCDRSAADAQFVFFALKRRRTVEELAAKLLEVSDRAKESGMKYVERTIVSGVEYLRRQGAQAI
jgi:hypothetical protein